MTTLFERFYDIIREHHSFLITTHVNPDADAIGSELAVYFILERLGKRVSIINHSETPYNLEFLDEKKVIRKFDRINPQREIIEAEVILFLDLNQINRTVSMESIINNHHALKICIDHHQDPSDFADLMIVDRSANATAEIIYDFISHTRIIEIDYEIALQLYAAIMTDSGSFRHERTNSKVHLIAAALLEKGVDPTDVYDKIYDQSKLGKLKLLGRSISGMRLSVTKRIAYMVVSKTDLEETGAAESEVDGFVNYCLSVENVVVGILFFELKDGIKISFRSKGNIPINKLAAEFGGGGHSNAAGTRLFDVKIDEYIDKVIAAGEKILTEGDSNVI